MRAGQRPRSCSSSIDQNQRRGCLARLPEAHGAERRWRARRCGSRWAGRCGRRSPQAPRRRRLPRAARTTRRRRRRRWQGAAGSRCSSGGPRAVRGSSARGVSAAAHDQPLVAAAGASPVSHRVAMSPSTARPTAPALCDASTSQPVERQRWDRRAVMTSRAGHWPQDERPTSSRTPRRARRARLARECARPGPPRSSGSP